MLRKHFRLPQNQLDRLFLLFGRINPKKGYIEAKSFELVFGDQAHKLSIGTA